MPWNEQGEICAIVSRVIISFHFHFLNEGTRWIIPAVRYFKTQTMLVEMNDQSIGRSGKISFVVSTTFKQTNQIERIYFLGRISTFYCVVYKTKHRVKWSMCIIYLVYSVVGKFSRSVSFQRHVDSLQTSLAQVHRKRQSKQRRSRNRRDDTHWRTKI